MPPVKYSSSCPPSRTVVVDEDIGRLTSCLFCKFADLNATVVTEHMWTRHPLMMRRKKHLLSSTNILARKRQISESMAGCDDVGSSGGSPAPFEGKGNNSDDECAYNLKEKCTLGEPLPKRSPAMSARSSLFRSVPSVRQSLTACGVDDAKLMFGLQSVTRSNCPILTQSMKDYSNWHSTECIQQSVRHVQPSMKKEWDTDLPSDKALDLSMHGRKPLHSPPKQQPNHQPTNNYVTIRPNQSVGSVYRPQVQPKPNNSSGEKIEKSIDQIDKNQFNFPVEINVKSNTPTPVNQYGNVAMNSFNTMPLHNSRAVSNLEALSTVATHILYGKQFTGHHQHQNVETNKSTMPILTNEILTNKCRKPRSANANNQQTTKLPKNKTNVMSPEGVRKLQSAVQNINCFDPNEASMIMPMRIENKWKQVRAKRIGQAWIIQIPNRDQPVVFVPQNTAPVHQHQANKANVKLDSGKKSPLMKSLLQQKGTACGSLVKKLLLQKKTVSNSRS